MRLEKLSQPNKSLLGVFMRWYTCGDGRDLMVWAQNLQAADTFLKLLGIEKRLKSEGYQNAGPWVTGLDNNLMALSPEHHEHVSNVISEALLAKPAHEWETLLAEAGVAVAMIRTRDEWMSLDRAHKGGLFTEMNELTVPGQFADVSGPEGGSVTNSFAEPEDISLSDAVALFAAGAPKPAVQADAAPLKKGELLKSLKVLDLTNLVAGPTSTYTLAQYGAEVIKADPPRFVHPALIASSMLEANQGKRSILTDLTTAPGRDVFARLVKWADIVVHNSVDGVAERLGVTQAQLQAINPDVVVCQFSFLGGLHRGAGGLEGWSGFDSLVQGINGIMTHYGTLAYPQFHGQIICGDIMGGIGGTYAALLAIYQKRRTGYAGEARTSLARMINYMQLPGMIMKDGSSDQGEARGQFTLGEGPSARLYECADRWLYVEARGDGIAELNEFVTGTPDADEKALEAAFAEKPYGYWQAKLDALDIPCHLAATVADICAEGITSVPNEASDEVARGTVEVLVRPHHPAGRPILNLAPTWARIGEDQTYKRLTPALRYGDGTEAILKELGYGEEEIKDLIRLRVSHTHLPSMGSESAYFFEPENCK